MYFFFYFFLLFLIKNCHSETNYTIKIHFEKRKSEFYINVDFLKDSNFEREKIDENYFYESCLNALNIPIETPISEDFNNKAFCMDRACKKFNKFEDTIGSSTLELRVYDLSYSLTKFMDLISSTPIGEIYHTAVIFHRKEVLFSYRGMLIGEVGSFSSGQYIETLHLSKKIITDKEFYEKLKELSASTFCEKCYNVMNNNCNDFSQEIFKSLTGVSIPEKILTITDRVRNHDILGFTKQLENFYNLFTQHRKDNYIISPDFKFNFSEIQYTKYEIEISLIKLDLLYYCDYLDNGLYPKALHDYDPLFALEELTFHNMRKNCKIPKSTYENLRECKNKYESEEYDRSKCEEYDSLFEKLNTISEIYKDKYYLREKELVKCVSKSNNLVYCLKVRDYCQPFGEKNPTSLNNQRHLKSTDVYLEVDLKEPNVFVKKIYSTPDKPPTIKNTCILYQNTLTVNRLEVFTEFDLNSNLTVLTNKFMNILNFEFQIGMIKITYTIFDDFKVPVWWSKNIKFELASVKSKKIHDSDQIESNLKELIGDAYTYYKLKDKLIDTKFKLYVKINYKIKPTGYEFQPHQVQKHENFKINLKSTDLVRDLKSKISPKLGNISINSLIMTLNGMEKMNDNSTLNKYNEAFKKNSTVNVSRKIE